MLPKYNLLQTNYHEILKKIDHWSTIIS